MPDGSYGFLTISAPPPRRRHIWRRPLPLGWTIDGEPWWATVLFVLAGAAVALGCLYALIVAE